MYIPSITYPLATSALSKRQLHQIEKGPLNAIISKIGMCSKTSRDVIFGPINMGGRALRSLYTEQGTLQIKLMLTESRRGSTIGNILFIALQWVQYNCGMGTPILEMTSECTHNESKYLKSIHQFLVENCL